MFSLFTLTKGKVWALGIDKDLLSKHTPPPSPEASSLAAGEKHTLPW